MPEVAGAKRTRSKWMPWLLVSLTLCILAAGITLITLHLRKVVHQQMLSSYAEVIHAAYVANTDEEDEEFSDLPAETQQLLTILEASEARTGVFSVRLFDKRGRPNAKF